MRKNRKSKINCDNFFNVYFVDASAYFRLTEPEEWLEEVKLDSDILMPKGVYGESLSILGEKNFKRKLGSLNEIGRAKLLSNLGSVHVFPNPKITRDLFSTKDKVKEMRSKELKGGKIGRRDMQLIEAAKNHKANYNDQRVSLVSLDRYLLYVGAEYFRRCGLDINIISPYENVEGIPDGMTIPKNVSHPYLMTRSNQ